MDESIQRKKIEERILESIERIKSAKSPQERDDCAMNTWKMLRSAYTRYIRAIVAKYVWISEEVEDVCVAIWVDALASLKEHPEKWIQPRNYLSGIAVMHCLRWRRQAAIRGVREVPLPESESPALATDGKEVENTAVHNTVFWSEFDKCFSLLTPTEQEVIRLLRLGYESAEIKQILGLKQDAYNQRVSRARQKLVPCMKEAGFDGE